MASIRRVAVAACIVFVAALATSLAAADTVKCEPLIKDGRVVGYCFTVCNTPEEPCMDASCIYDLHLQIVGKCKFVKVRSLPAGWTAAVAADGSSAHAVTPPPTGGDPAPIHHAKCKRFCFVVQCSTQDCFVVDWHTTDQQGQILDQGRTKCCPPVAAAG